LVESAVKNGVRLLTSFAVERAEREGAHWRVHAVDGRSLLARYVVNAAGLRADDVSRTFAAESFRIEARKGEYYLLDRLTKACPDRVVFPVPTEISKGILVIPTPEGTVLIGPTAVRSEDKADTATSESELEKLLDAAKKIIPGLSANDVITSFAGLRPVLGDDFYIEPSKIVPNFIQVAGIQSPGLTASPAIGEYVKDLLRASGLKMTEKRDWDPSLEKLPRLREMTPFETDRLVRENPAYGNIVCRCEKVSEAEIVEAIRRGHTTLDGIKYFTRSGMGRCQGGFCTYKILKILMRESGIAYDRITKHGPGSEVLKGEL
jgi:glycerol-3-phosphate dehydrogenase